MIVIGSTVEFRNEAGRSHRIERKAFLLREEAIDQTYATGAMSLHSAKSSGQPDLSGISVPRLIRGDGGFREGKGMI